MYCSLSLVSSGVPRKVQSKSCVDLYLTFTLHVNNGSIMAVNVHKCKQKNKQKLEK